MAQARWANLTRGERWVLPAFLACAALMGAVIGNAIELPGLFSLNPGTVVLILAFTLSVPYLVRNWRASLGLLLVWLVVEDLLRKLAGNDLRIYFAKDVIFLVVLVGLCLDRDFRRWWAEATGATRYALYALVGWALVMSVSTWWIDPRLPLIGLRLDFMYAPLVAAGFAIGSRRTEMRRWLLFAASIAALISLVGVVQATIGPSFLSPGRPTPGLIHLELFRGLDRTVYRPTATFVDPGRFGSYAVLGFAISLAAIVISSGRKRVFALACAAANGAGIWVSGGRTGLLMGVVLFAFAATAGPVAEGRLAPGRAVRIVISLVLGGAILTAFLPSVIGTRLQWYVETLDPRSPSNEWTFRARNMVDNTRAGLEIGGLMGTGTGSQSLGKQYLSGNPDTIAGLYAVEGGYAAVAVEWGAIGVALWAIWSVAWVIRQWRSIKSARGSRVAAAGLVLLAWMLFFLFFGFAGGLQEFQNYLANAYFWLLSGLIFALPLAASDVGRPPGPIGTTVVDVSA